MSIDVLAVVVLLAVFLVGTISTVNIGALALVGAFALGTLVLGEDVPTILSGFPANLFTLLFGITYLFSVAAANGTTEWLVMSMARLVRGNARVVPLLLFAVTAAVTSAGAPGQAAAGIMAPIGISLAREFGIRPLLAGLMVVTGVGAGTFSPLSTLGIIANEAVAGEGFDVSPVTLWLGTLAFNVVLAVAVYVVLGGLRATGERLGDAVRATDGGGTPLESAPSAGTGGGGAATVVRTTAPVMLRPRLDAARATTLVAIALVALGSLVLGWDIGMLAIVAAVAVHVVFPRKANTAHISWNVILLVCGLVTLIEVLDRAGTITRIGEGVAGVGSPVVSALLLCGVAALVSAFASSTGVIGAIVPLAIPLMALGHLSPTALLIAIALSATVVDASPFSSVGALVVASAPEDQQRSVSRKLLTFGLTMIVVAPLASVLLFVLPAQLG
ncbi:SLC13 family permease [Geodermatophilus sp. SYSU D01186]